MPEIRKVTDLTKIVTDELVLHQLARQGIDKDYVEFFQDYAPRWRRRADGTRYGVKESSPYAKFYRDLKSGKRFMVVSGLPMVKAEGRRIEVGWFQAKRKYYSKANLFSAIVDGKQVKLACLSDQPDGTERDEQVTWQPQLFVDGIEIVNGSEPALLPVDPVNEGYQENTLEWTYGTVCKRRIRLIEGRFRERWLFESNPHSKVRIKHNFTGSLKLKLGYAIDAEGNPLQVSVIGDEEIVEASEFDKAVYPIEIGAADTFYPDAHEETTSVDGYVRHYELDLTWADIRGAAGQYANDNANEAYIQIREDTDTADRYHMLYRVILLFDTSGLPDTADISAATLSLYGASKQDDRGWAPAYNIYSSNPNTNTAIIAGDYATLGDTAFCDTAVTYANWKTGDPFWNDFALNAAGIAAISKTSVSKFGGRESNYDAPNHDPGSGGQSKLSNMKHYTADKGTGFKPKLVVTYTVPVEAPTVTTQDANGIGFD